jgi:outer membrane lipoprotein SlyB
MMQKYLMGVVIITGLLFSGCATNTGPEYDGNTYAQIKQIEVGTILSERPVVISDSGTGSFVGALVGAVLGSTVGRGDGATLAMLAGGLFGSYAGSEINKANAQELTVEIDNSHAVVVVAKGNAFHAGERVKIIKDGNKVAAVEKLQ